MSSMSAFQRAYESHSNYPLNLNTGDIYAGNLEALKFRLDDEGPRLCCPETTPASVFFGDFTQGNTLSYHETECANEQQLVDLLKGVSVHNVTAGSSHSTPDPNCRFVFLTAKHSRATLKITRRMLTRTLSYHQVAPGYLDFLFVFGKQTNPIDQAFAGFREQTSFRCDPNSPDLAVLGRSGKQLQLCYNLKGVASKSPPTSSIGSMEWSIRQVAVYHKYDFGTGKTLWILTRGGLDIKTRVEGLIGSANYSLDSAESSFRSSLALHLLYSYWAAENWRWYLRWRERLFADTTGKAAYSLCTPHPTREEYTAQHIQDIQRQEDETNEAILALDSNLTVLASLQSYYEKLPNQSGFAVQNCNEEASKFTAQLDAVIYDLKMQLLRARHLSQLIADRKGLVHQLLQTQTTEKTESLSIKMNSLAVEAQKETIAMRIITIVTLFFLPATFVSKTFFSTDIVKYQNGDGSGSFSSLALWRWLEVAIPLTVITLLVGWYCYDRSRRRDDLSPDIPMRKMTYRDSVELEQV